MTAREKLIELLEDVPVSYELCMRIKGHCPTTETPCYECLADYLLSNGVTFVDRPVGHWIWYEVSGGRKRCKCSECGESHGSMETVCCPNCGVRMEGVE